MVGRKAFGLGALLEEFFGVQADKRFQRADWSLRPLPADQLRYAQQDTHYLPQLRDYLRAEIEAQHRMAEAYEVFETLTRGRPPKTLLMPMATGGSTARAILRDDKWRFLRELYLWRDDVARYRDNPAFKVMSDAALTALVLANPHTMAELFDVRELSASQARRYGAELLKALSRGQSALLPNRPERPQRIDPLIQARYDALHQWRKDRAAERGVESDIILSKEVMWTLARRPPNAVDDLAEVQGLGPWRRETYGADLIRVVSEAAIAPVEPEAAEVDFIASAADNAAAL